MKSVKGDEIGGAGSTVGKRTFEFDPKATALTLKQSRFPGMLFSIFGQLRWL